jgi:molybdopterin synthase catalytic subunit
VIRIQEEEFDVNAELARLRADPRVGAIACFIGVVRDLNDGDSVASMTLEHYPGMTGRRSKASSPGARALGSLQVLVVRRVGKLRPTDRSCWSSSRVHRGAFAACEFVMTI